jgi:hypothetical protein
MMVSIDKPLMVDALRLLSTGSAAGWSVIADLGLLQRLFGPKSRLGPFHGGTVLPRDAVLLMEDKALAKLQDGEYAFAANPGAEKLLAKVNDINGKSSKAKQDFLLKLIEATFQEVHMTAKHIGLPNPALSAAFHAASFAVICSDGVLRFSSRARCSCLRRQSCFLKLSRSSRRPRCRQQTSSRPWQPCASSSTAT